MMHIRFKITDRLLGGIRDDLYRPHAFAFERVGFIGCRIASLQPKGIIVLAHSYYPVADEDYLDDRSVGAMMGPGAIRKALQIAYNNEFSMFHVHSHGAAGTPRFSRIDLSETARFVPDFWKVRPHFPHGAIVLSDTSGSGLCWYRSGENPSHFPKIIAVGAPLTII